MGLSIDKITSIESNADVVATYLYEKRVKKLLEDKNYDDKILKWYINNGIIIKKLIPADHIKVSKMVVQAFLSEEPGVAGIDIIECQNFLADVLKECDPRYSVYAENNNGEILSSVFVKPYVPITDASKQAPNKVLEPLYQMYQQCDTHPNVEKWMDKKKPKNLYNIFYGANSQILLMVPVPRFSLGVLFGNASVYSMRASGVDYVYVRSNGNAVEKFKEANFELICEIPFKDIYDDSIKGSEYVLMLDTKKYSETGKTKKETGKKG